MTENPSTDAALILVVEDEADLRRDITEELTEAGHQVLAAEDGRRALAILEGDVAPDLVLCDITMPGVDGYEVLAQLRENRPDLATTPFIFLTALSEPAAVIEGKRMGADDYLVKPIDYDLMLATVAARLRQIYRIRDQHKAEVEKLRRAFGALTLGEDLPDAAEQALDLIALGVILLDGRGQMLHANQAARDMAKSSGVIRLRGVGQRIEAISPLSDRQLRQAIAASLDAAAAGQDAVSGVMLPDKGEALIPISVCALPRLGSEIASGLPHVALFLSAPLRARRSPEPLLSQLFALTPTEARVAFALADGTRPADIADMLGVSQTTITFHMRNLFQKTGTNRQTDLVALILAGPMAIR